MVKQWTEEEQLDQIFDTYDDLFRGGFFNVADGHLRALDDKNLALYSVQLLVGLLAATLPAKDKLTERAAFVARVEARLRQTETPERVERLMVGLR